MSNNWKNRIVDQGEKPADEFKFNPNNWREHSNAQRNALDEILSRIGWVQGVIVNRTTGHLVDGHARIEQSLKQGEKTPVPFIEVELSEEEENLILMLLDPIGAMAQANAEDLTRLNEMVNLDSSALLEVIADLQVISDIETLELPKEDSSMGVTLNYLAFGGNKIPITEAELSVLNTRYQAHVAETGTNFGFINNLLGV